jgi:hypothetical protein
MARNPVQFQKGLGLAEFNALYGREDKCHAALIRMRWPEGFVCGKCGERKHSYANSRRVFQCSVCRTQTTVKAGTIFHKSKTPLVKWFLAIYLLTQSKNDIAALELARQLGVKWDTAWLIKQKLMETMRQRNRTYKLKGKVQLDDAYLGGEKPGKRGRGAANKIPCQSSLSRRVRTSPSIRNCGASLASPARRSRHTPCRISSPARTSPAMALPVLPPWPRRG